MVEAAKDWPDFTRATLLVGVDDDGNPVGVYVDSEGNLSALLKGETAAEALKAIRVDNDGQLIIIPRGKTGNYLDVDTSGFLTAVLKGAFAGALHTIAVDVNGRIEAFVLDSESQWGSVIRVGNSELAARLGGAVAFDWRGQVYYVHDFSDGKGGLYCTTSGAGASAVIDSEFKMRGGFSLKLTGGSDSSRYAKAQGIVGRNPSSRLGFLVAVSSWAETTDIILRARPTTTRYIGVLRYNWGFQRLSYLDGAGVYQTIGTVNCQVYPYVFNSFKVVIDVSTFKYVRALVNDTEFDLSTYDLETDAAGYPGTCEYEILTTSRSGENDYNHIDHIVLTVNEP